MTIVKFSNASVVLLMININNFHSELHWMTKDFIALYFTRQGRLAM